MTRVLCDCEMNAFFFIKEGDYTRDCDSIPIINTLSKCFPIYFSLTRRRDLHAYNANIPKYVNKIKEMSK